MVDDLRVNRFNDYVSRCDSDVDIKEFVFHTFVINQQGTGKDLFLNAVISYHYSFDKSLFDDILCNMLMRPHYKKHLDNIYSNCKLNKEVFSDDYYFIEKVSDVRDANRGFMYFNDMEKWFNSRGMDMTKPSPVCIDIVNNTRKEGILMGGSAHRFMSVDVKIRELFQLICKPDMFLKPECDWRKLSSWVVVVNLYDCYGCLLLSFPVEDLWKYCGLYDTFEKALPLVNDL